jgi:cytochrome P450
MSSAPLPPGPKGRWLSGNLAEYRRDRLSFFTYCARTYGDVVRVRFGPRRIYLICHPDLIEEVLLTRSREFIKHFALRLNPLVLGNGLLTSEGDFWLRQRRLIQPAFQKGRITAYAGEMLAAAERILGEWRPGERRDLLTEMERLTLRIAARTLFGADVGPEGYEVHQILDFLQQNFLYRFNHLFHIPAWIPTPNNLRVKRSIRRLDEIVYRFIAQRRQDSSDRNDLLSLLLRARDEQGQAMSDQQLRDEAMTLFLAGHETTALTLTWTWYLLASHPHVEERLYAEVREVLDGRTPTVEDVPRLRYTEHVILESMRLIPAIYTIGREALHDLELGGFRVPRGTTLLMPQWVVHRDPRFWDDPETFRPERWAEPRMKNQPHFAYFPFGGGPRVCVGNNFALLETALILPVIAQRFHFTLIPDHPVVPHPSFTLRPRDGLPAIITPRPSPQASSSGELIPSQGSAKQR